MNRYLVGIDCADGTHVTAFVHAEDEGAAIQAAMLMAHMRLEGRAWAFKLADSEARDVRQEIRVHVT